MPKLESEFGGNSAHKSLRTVKIAEGRLSSEELFGKLRQLVISHNGQDYRLSITAAGKLILTK